MMQYQNSAQKRYTVSFRGRRLDLSFPLESLLVAMLINLNAVKILLRIPFNSKSVYVIFIGCILVSVVKDNLMLSTGDKTIRITLLMAVPIIVYSFLSCIWTGFDNLFSSFKLLISILLFFSISKMRKKQLKCVIVYSLLINTVFSTALLLRPRMLSYYAGSINYLNVTLSLGFILSISLTASACLAVKSKFTWKTALYIAFSLLFLVTLTTFIARGPIVIPIIIAVAMLILIGVKNIKKGFVAFGLFALVGLFGWRYYTSHASGYALARMQSLIFSTSNESRIGIWKLAIKTIFENYWFLLGGGTNAFSNSVIRYYPHNIVIQMVGEYGIYGLCFLAYIMISACKSMLKYNSHISSGKIFDVDFYLIYSSFAGWIYFFLTYCKSFSMYDAYPFYIMFAVFVRLVSVSEEDSQLHDNE